MALNFSYRPIFPAHLSEENSVSPMSISGGFVVDGAPERNSDVYGMSWLINRELENCLDFLEDTYEGGGSRDCVPGDVLDLLPSDPFGMDMSTTFTAITGWLDDLNVDYGGGGGGGGGGSGRDERVLVDESNQLFAGLNYIWNNAFRLQSFPHGNEGIVHSSGERGGFSEWSDGRNVGGLSCHTDPQSSYVVDTIQTLGIEPEISGGGFGSWSDERNAGGLSCHTDLESPFVLDTIQTLGIEPEISGGGFGAWSDGRTAGCVSFRTDLESPRHVVDTIQAFSIEPEISGGGFGAWSDGRTVGCVSLRTDLESPRHVMDTIQTLGIEPEISGGGFGAWSDGRTADCVSFRTDLESPRHVVDTIQTLGIEPEISGGGFGAWSDGRTAGCVSFRTDLESPRHVVDTIQTLGIEPEISGGGFSTWSDGRTAGCVSFCTDLESPRHVVDTIRTYSIDPEISGRGFGAWSDGRTAACVSLRTDLESPRHVVDTIQNFSIEPEISGGGFGAWSDGRRAGGVSCHTDPESPPYSLDIIRTLSIEPEISEVQPVVLEEGNCVSSDAGEPPHAALNFVLGYLGTRELLVIESVCKSLQSTAEDDPFFWRNINICGKVDVKITDDILLKLTSKAQGGLESLSLVNCVMISDNGLNEVLFNNPKVTKLCVPGCTRLTIGGIVDSLKAFKLKGRPGLKHLSIAGMYGVTEAHFKELEKLLLGTDNLTQLNTHEPRFYRGGIHFPSCNDGRAIDIERCPKCMNMRIVYDCPVVGCKGIKEGDTDPNANAQRCRGCTLCIARCNWCGRCIDETVHEETFSLDLRCIDCGKKISKCE
ncbi:F-box protein SKIP14-like isoform X3 [Cucurbita moschata]|uniref:F-box protein SKIP14-like isoform X3 n=1 Tax=Cucurbita moschata TaxID=3662 RepID=A0A6J1FZG1_CUCMO|nr:F-box protein SKIP14-like isoform X3 [Cucurbita moschata]